MTLPPLVIADTSPISYLIRMKLIHLLPALYGQVYIPLEVQNELLRAQHMNDVLEWARNPPAWLSIESPRKIEARLQLKKLDAGEEQAIALALELHADLLLIDDLHGRNAAEEAGLRSTGTLGILAEAAFQKIIDFETSVELLLKTNFYTTEELVHKAREKANRRV